MSIEVFGRIFKFLVDPEQWAKLFAFIRDYFFTKPISIIAVVCFLISFYIIFGCLFGKITDSNKNKKRALGCYVIGILVLSVLNRDPGKEHILRLSFDSWLAGATGYHESNVLISILNCCYFFPYGGLIKWQFKKNTQFLVCTGVVIFSAFMIEFLQYILKRGVASVSDFIFYIIGGLSGILVANIIQKKNRRDGNNE